MRPTSVRYAVGSVAMNTAVDLAKRHWGADPCAGQVTLQWAADASTINARAYWSNPVALYGNALHNYDCRIVFNTKVWLDWDRFCTVMVHEFGHLAGYPHTVRGTEIMSPVLRKPLPACTGILDPAAAPASFSPCPSAPARKTRRTASDVAMPPACSSPRHRPSASARTSPSLPTPLAGWLGILV